MAEGPGTDTRSPVLGHRLATFTKMEDMGSERLEWVWVVGPAGAVTTWFSDTRPIIGRYVCDGLVFHTPVNVPKADLGRRACPFLETRCSHWRRSMQEAELLAAMRQDAADDLSGIYAYMADVYDEEAQQL